MIDERSTKLLRTALMEIPAVQAQETLQPPALANIIIPDAHWQALELDSLLVVGDRGTGKSFWTAVLADNAHRAFVARMINSPILADAETRVGFSVDQSNRLHPNRVEMDMLVGAGISCEAIWNAVVYRHLADILGRRLPVEDAWKPLCTWVSSVAGGLGSILAEFDEEFTRKKKTALLIFDSFDTLSDEWPKMRARVKAALQVALQLRNTRSIKTKFFLRPDMAQDDAIWEFPDSSKLKHGRIDLKWTPTALFSIVLRYMANHSSAGEVFRAACMQKAIMNFTDSDGIFLEPRAGMVKESGIKAAIELLTGRWMGNGAKRGYCYSWIPVHLSDAKGVVSPRSILLAFREAARVTDARYFSHGLPLHFEGIKSGVVKASAVRVDELKEGYPWVATLLQALEGQTVPINIEQLISLWKQAIEYIESKGKLPPRRFNEDPVRKGQISALIDDLAEIGVLYRTSDNRINIPDIFRVGYKIGRKGGVKPLT